MALASWARAWNAWALAAIEETALAFDAAAAKACGLPA